MGRNFMAHVGSDFAIRIHGLPCLLPGTIQTAALVVRGKALSVRFHL